jgi:uncharacterized protein involved in exopolysaccharide biosynthesis
MNDTNPTESKREVEIRYVHVPVIQETKPLESPEDQLVDLTEMLRMLWRGRIRIILITAVFTVIGILFTLSTPTEYTVNVKVIPEIQIPNANLGRLGGLAAQFGLGGSMGSGSVDFIPTQMYPEILSSTYFLGEIITKQVYLDSIQDSITYQEYFIEHQESNTLVKYTLGLPSMIIKSLRPASDSVTNDDNQQNNFQRVNPLQIAAMNRVSGSTELVRVEDTGVFNIRVTTQHPEVSLQLSKEIYGELSNYLTRYKTEKARNNLVFIQERLEDARIEFEYTQTKMAQLIDQNKGALTESARMMQQMLQSEYNVKFNVYNSLTDQSEQAKIKVQEETPVLTIIQPPLYPLKKSGPNHMIIVFISAFLGLFGSIAYQIMSPIVSKIKQDITLS